MNAGDRTPKGTIPGVGTAELAGSEVQATGYAAGQTHYQLYGWEHVLPLPAGRKETPPTGYTGRNAKTPTPEKMTTWRQRQGDGNLALYLRPGLLGMDVDHYGEKHGGDTLAELEARLGPLPATWRSSSRPDDPTSGIRLYRVPEGLEWPGGMPGIELIHSGHRYVVAWPSIHPEGRQYRWYSPGGELEAEPVAGDLPDPTELPELPEAWVAELTGGQAERSPEARGEALPVDELLTDGEPCPAVLKARASYGDSTASGQARHDAMLKAGQRLIRLGEQGHAGSRTSYAELREAFVAEVSGDRTGGEREAEAEWRRAEAGAVGKVTGKPTPAAGRRCCGSAEATTESSATNLPESFWQSRPVLAHIRDAARSASTSPDAVLGAVLARLSAMVSPELRFHTGIGVAGSLNLITALVGPSGSGKSSANDVARELVPAPPWLDGESFRDGLPLGSGEGLIESYFGLIARPTGDVYKSGDKKGQPKTEYVRDQVRHHVFFYQDEGAALTKMLERVGATIATMLRSAWSGGLVGQANARTETTRVLQPATYSLGLTIGYQPGAAQALLTSEQIDGGTPQRFVFLSAIDPDAPDVPPEHPGQLDSVPMLAESTGDAFAPAGGGKPRTGLVQFPDSVKDELRTRRLAGLRGERQDDELTSHAPLLRAKLAVLLALLDGRGEEVSEEDWRLSGVVWDTSCALRDELVEHGREEAQRVADARDDAAVSRAARVAVAQAQAGPSAERIARHLARRVHDTGTQTLGAAKKQLAGRDKRLFREALDVAVALDWLTVDEDGKKVGPGTSQPVES